MPRRKKRLIPDDVMDQVLAGRAVRARGHFPNDEAALKLFYLALNRAEKEWVMPPREGSMAKAQFAILFGDRFARAEV